MRELKHNKTDIIKEQVSNIINIVENETGVALSKDTVGMIEATIINTIDDTQDTIHHKTEYLRSELGNSEQELLLEAINFIS